MVALRPVYLPEAFMRNLICDKCGDEKLLKKDGRYRCLRCVREHNRQAQKRRREENPDMVRAIGAAYMQRCRDDPEKMLRLKEGYKKWYCSIGDNPERWARQTIRNTRKRSTVRGIECTITPADIMPLPEICPLLGISLDYSRGTKGKGGFRNNSPSIDRIDNTRGYVPGNVWVISYRANSIKRDATVQELQDIAAILPQAIRARSEGRKYQ
jgi:hypothetical protein